MSTEVDCPRVQQLVVKGPLDFWRILAHWAIWQLEVGDAKCAVQFCVVDVQATVNHSLYYRSRSAPHPVLFAVSTVHLVK
uniref:Uncharacterized protein n=1 Tax=Romanomermis culicivorax TaxID=13658 RepID=A0A915IRD1_ROMCU